ncbi:hypothetical protein D3C75_1045680 [compost metagenome]
MTQVVSFRQIKFSITATRQAFRQLDVTVTHTNQTANLHTNRFPQATHFTVAAFGQSHVVPLVYAFATGKFDGFECRWAIFKLHATTQLFHFVVVNFAKYTHRVFTLNFTAWVHQAVCQLTISGEKQ